MKKQMERSASDNTYLHRDFHSALNRGLMYLEERFGVAAISEYLTDYAENYFRSMSLTEIKEYLRGIYAAEEAEEAITFAQEPGKLHVTIISCPAVAFLKTPMRHYRLTTEVVYAVLAKMSGLIFTLHSYDEQTGAAYFSFEEAGI